MNRLSRYRLPRSSVNMKSGDAHGQPEGASMLYSPCPGGEPMAYARVNGVNLRYREAGKGFVDEIVDPDARVNRLEDPLVLE